MPLWADSLKQKIVGVAEQVAKLPIISPVLGYFFPQEHYTLSSAMVKNDKYPRGDVRHYIAEMLAALQQPKNEQEETAASSIFQQLEKDLPRFSFVNSSLEGVVLSSSFKDGLSVVDRTYERKAILESFLAYVVLQATDTGKNWVTKDKLRGIVGHLSQGMMAEIQVVLQNNSEVIATRSGKQPELVSNLLAINDNSSFPLIANLTDDPCIATLAIEQQKISLHYKLYYACFGDQLNPKDVERDLEVNVTIEIDLACLSEEPGKMQPGSNAITETVSVQSVSKQISFAFTGKIKELEKGLFSDDDIVIVGNTNNTIIPIPDTQVSVEEEEPKEEEQSTVNKAFGFVKRNLWIPGFIQHTDSSDNKPQDSSAEKNKNVKKKLE